MARTILTDKIKNEIITRLGNKRWSVRSQRIWDELTYWREKLGYFPEFHVEKTTDRHWGYRRNRDRGCYYTTIGATGGQYNYIIWLVIDPRKKLQTHQ